MQHALCSVLLVIATTATPFGQIAADGEIAGRATDDRAGALPGVRISISSSGERRETITDSDGRFVLGNLKLGTYRVTAELAGFLPTSGTITLSPQIRRAYVAWPLEVGCIEEHIRVELGAREAAAMVDAIAHVRVSADSGPLLWSTRPECAGVVVHSYTVEILNAAVRRSGMDSGRTTLQILQSSSASRLKPGGEYVGLFWPGWRAADDLLFPVVSGRISSPAPEALRGMQVKEALEVLGQWSREPRR